MSLGWSWLPGLAKVSSPSVVIKIRYKKRSVMTKRFIVVCLSLFAQIITRLELRKVMLTSGGNKWMYLFSVLGTWNTII